MRQRIIGWDIGGAHVKAAVVESTGVVSGVFLESCPLWKGIEYLEQAIENIKAEIKGFHCLHAITMTGELVDWFENRDQGIEQIIQTMQKMLSDCELFIYSGSYGFLSPDDITLKHYESIASVNWLASASFTASQLKNGLFIDIGSTTTDLLILSEHKVQAIGITDYERLVSDELVYTGIIRTAVMAVAQKAAFKGVTMGLMAEYFATMADVYRLTGELNEIHDKTETADGAEKTVLASAKRLSRMTGYEFSENDLGLWQQLANHIKQQQKQKIKLASEKQLARDLITQNDCFIGAGVGRFLVKQIAEDMNYPYIDFSDLIQAELNDRSMDIADCAPAVSVALLLYFID